MSTKDWLRFWALGLIWGTSFLWIKIAVTEISPYVLVGFRTLLGAFGLFALFVIGKSSGLRWRELRPWIAPFAVVAFFNVAFPWMLISWSEQYIPSSVAAILNSTAPLFTMLFAPWMLKDDRLTKAKLIGLFIGFIGVVALFAPQLSEKLDMNIIGQGAMLLAAGSYGLGGVFARRNGRGISPQLQSFLQLSLASMMAWGFTFVFERPVGLPHLPITWFGLLWLGLLGSCLAYILYFSLIHSIGPTRTSMVTYILPLVGVILGTLFLSERLHWTTLLGGALILSGIAVVNVKPKKSTIIPELRD
ncbi:MAG: DMT family transporter [Anaerolineaceae bacterium]|nr:DMT family transporter [Anaerolineaceae bacterium]